MRRALYWLLQCSWGILQTLAGGAVCLCQGRCRREWYRSALITYWRREAGLSLGPFIFLPENKGRLAMHEYGHTIQSLILGPLFLPLIGVPSVLWAGLPAMRRLRRRRRMSYFELPPERWANRLGQRATGERPPR